jgi:hypothetical protein
VSVALPPGHYVVTPDPGGELSLFGVRMRVLEGKPDKPKPSPIIGVRRVPVQILLIVAALARRKV